MYSQRGKSHPRQMDGWYQVKEAEKRRREREGERGREGERENTYKQGSQAEVVIHFRNEQ